MVVYTIFKDSAMDLNEHMRIVPDFKSKYVDEYVCTKTKLVHTKLVFPNLKPWRIQKMHNLLRTSPVAFY